MSLPIEEVDKEGRAIFFKSPADVSKSVEFNSHDLSTHYRVNDLYNERRLPAPKFRGFIYNYSPFLTLCSCSDSGRQKVKQKVDYKSIQAIYPCERDPAVVFMVITNSKGRYHIRVLRLPTSIIGTKFRYVTDQLQLSPIRETGYFKNDSVRTNLNSGSSFSTPMAEESDASVTSASHYFYRSAAHNPTMRAFYAKEEEEDSKLPRVQPFGFSSTAGSNLYPSRRSLHRQKSDIFDNFDPNDYEIYRPVSRKSRVDRCAYDYTGLLPRRQPSRLRYESSGFNYNSRAAVRNRSLVYLDPEYDEYKVNSYDYGVPQRSALDQTSRSGSVPRRYIYY